VNLTSPRVGNYAYNLWIAGPVLDQLWVR